LPGLDGCPVKETIYMLIKYDILDMEKDTPEYWFKRLEAEAKEAGEK